MAYDFLTAALRRDVAHMEGFKPITEADAQKLKKIQPAGTHFDGSVFFVSKDWQSAIWIADEV